MKRIGFLYHQISDYSNLLRAFHAASAGKRLRPEVRRFRDALHPNVQRLREELLAENPRLGDYHYFTIYDPKERRICAAAFRERVIHHAVMNVAGPHLERPLIDQTYACRRGMGQQRAARRAAEFAGRSPFFLKMDIRKYYDSIGHDRVAVQLSRILKDPSLLALFDQLLDTYHTAPGRGLPIGNLTSQYLANLYLSPFDHFVKHKLRCAAYVRYMDDFVLWGRRDQVREWRRAMIAFLEDRLGLQTKRGGFINRSRLGCDFLGYRIFPGRLRLSRRSARRLRAGVRRLERDYIEGRIGEDELQQRSTAMFAFADSADGEAFRRAVVIDTLLEDY